MALLRAVNVGGRNRVPMGDLREIAGELGVDSPATYLQSGNLVFATQPARAEQLRRELHSAIAGRLGVTTPVILRDLDALDAAIAANPFPEAAAEHPASLLVVFLERRGDPAGVPALQAAARADEQLQLVGSELFIHYRGGVANSRLTAAVLDKRLAAAGTARNWNTVLALAALARSVGKRE